MKTCKYCGVSYEKGYGSFCSKKCYMMNYNEKGAFRKEEWDNNVKVGKDILSKLEKVMLVSNKGRINNSSLKRVFSYVCCKIQNISTTVAGKALGVEHTTILHHLRKITDDEIEKAKIFASTMNTPQPRIKIKKENIYEKTGFRYDNGRKEVSVLWKRFYPQRQPKILHY